ncbi:DUF4105 domain-containing protein [Chromobacterium vaccinii]|uniref:lipoprotein N-acyltransferase Lnb domain-containing protein n=1 Tax=Chromobacterium vaccinii TaxID=1108595 RepID=UPI001E5671CE|nr:DUF4105 domain-containing protein [Chromobacterium vaccinii]MCD4483503.1 DUF4105 domain-containing protein [Chromobacterium vaccinii]
MKLRDIIAKGGSIAALFCLLAAHCAQAEDSLPEQLIATARSARLAETIEWQSLLHSQNGEPLVTDPDFLLSGQPFSAARELDATLRLLYGGARDAVCRFPARYWWLRKTLNAPELPLDQCQEVAHFRARAPMDRISLVFASENQALPASMLGHAFLKISGARPDGSPLEHAISFYTDADTWNLPKLLVDSLLIGKTGYFALSPYHEQLRRYVDQEQRSVWEYDLSFDAWQRELIRLHLLELKRARLTYFFQKYNCATVIHFIMGLSGKPLPAKRWLAPMELVREASDAGLVQSSRMIAPSRWLVRTLDETLPAARRRENQRALAEGEMPAGLAQPPSPEGFLQLEHAQALNQHLYLEQQLARERWLSNAARLEALERERYPGMSLDMSKGFGPMSTPPSSQASLSWLRRDGEDNLEISLVPASHRLDDDNRGYNQENELQILAPTFRMPLRGGAPRLQQFVLYGMQTLLPRDPIAGGLAGRLNIAYQQQLDQNLQERSVAQINGALGLARRVQRDADFYALAGGGLATAGRQGYAFGELEGGVMVRELWDMKTWLSVSRHFNQADSGSAFSRVSLRQIRYLNRNQSVSASWKQEQSGALVRREWQLGYKQLF